MHKIELTTINGHKTYDYETARIYTSTYSVKIKENEIHAPNAAKLIFEGNGKIASFILLNPLIQVDESKNITISTSSTMDQALLKQPYNIEGLKPRKVMKEYKMYQSRLTLGATIEDLVMSSYTKSHYEAMILENTKVNPHKGGGF